MFLYRYCSVPNFITVARQCFRTVSTEGLWCATTLWALFRCFHVSTFIHAINKAVGVSSFPESPVHRELLLSCVKYVGLRCPFKPKSTFWCLSIHLEWKEKHCTRRSQDKYSQVRCRFSPCSPPRSGSGSPSVYSTWEELWASFRQEGRYHVCVQLGFRSRCQTCAWTAWCFHPGGQIKRAKLDWASGKFLSSRRVSEMVKNVWGGTFWHVSKNSSTVTTPSLFLSIFWKVWHKVTDVSQSKHGQIWLLHW